MTELDGTEAALGRVGVTSFPHRDTERENCQLTGRGHHCTETGSKPFLTLASLTSPRPQASERVQSEACGLETGAFASAPYPHSGGTFFLCCLLYPTSNLGSVTFHFLLAAKGICQRPHDFFLNSSETVLVFWNIPEIFY